MKINKTSNKLIEIEKLKNLRSINFKDLYASGDDNFLILPGFMILTDNGILYYTQDDEYFEDYVRRVREVYEEEKDEIIDNGFIRRKKIEIDPLTESILLNGKLEKTSSLYDFYKGKTPYKESLLFEEDKINSLKDIFIYHIKEILSLFELSITDIELSGGMNGVYYIRCKIDNSPRILPLNFEVKDDSTYEMCIGNLFDNSIPLNMEVIFSKNSIIVNGTIPEYHFSNYTKYDFSKKATLEQETEVNGTTVNYKKEDLPEETPVNANLAFLDTNETITKWYHLPWNAYEGVKIEDKCIEQDGMLSDSPGNNRLVTKRLVYLVENETSFFLRDEISKRFKRISSNVGVELDNVTKTIIGLKQKDGIIFETTFTGCATTNFYKTDLLGNSFYHVCFKKDTKDISKEDLLPIGREEHLEENIDLLDIKKYIK